LANLDQEGAVVQIQVRRPWKFETLICKRDRSVSGSHRDRLKTNSNRLDQRFIDRQRLDPNDRGCAILRKFARLLDHTIGLAAALPAHHIPVDFLTLAARVLILTLATQASAYAGIYLTGYRE
jgi:hypothetical protein